MPSRGKCLEGVGMPDVLIFNKGASIVREELAKKNKAREEDSREPKNTEVCKSFKDSTFYSHWDGKSIENYGEWHDLTDILKKYQSDAF